MNKINFYYRQNVTEADLDNIQNNADTAIKRLVSDFGKHGFVTGKPIGPHSPANLTVDLPAQILYDKNGEKLTISGTQNINCAVDKDGNTTVPSTAGQERWIAVRAYFKTNLSNPQTDGNGATVQKNVDESYEFKVWRGTAVVAGSAVKPADPNDGSILLGHVKLATGNTTITASMIDTTGIEYVGTPATLNVKRFGAKGDGTTDDSTAVQACIDAASAMGGGIVYFPYGTYVLGNVNLKSFVTLQGSGWTCILKQRSGATWCVSVNSGSQGTTDPANNIVNVTIRDLQFLGTIQTDGFSEHVHLVNLNACSDFLMENCKIVAFRGDGVYIGSSNVGGTERHNERITIRKCHFDGVTKGNRNGISIIDCNGCFIEDCYFTRCSSTTMPGPIDIEPDANAFARAMNITIRNNKFYDNGGNVGVICAHVPSGQTALTNPIYGFIIEGNYIDTTTNVGIRFGQVQTMTDTTPATSLIIRNNTIRGALRPFMIFGTKHTLIEGNRFKDCPNGAYLGLTIGGHNQDVNIVNNVFDKVGANDDVGMYVFGNSRVNIERNTFVDCGGSDGALGYAIDFHGGNSGFTSSYVKVINNTIMSPASPKRTTFAIQKEASHTLTSSTNVKGLNSIISPVTGDAFSADKVL